MSGSFAFTSRNDGKFSPLTRKSKEVFHFSQQHTTTRVSPNCNNVQKGNVRHFRTPCKLDHGQSLPNNIPEFPE